MIGLRMLVAAVRAWERSGVRMPNGVNFNPEPPTRPMESPRRICAVCYAHRDLHYRNGISPAKRLGAQTIEIQNGHIFLPLWVVQLGLRPPMHELGAAPCMWTAG